MSTAATTLPDGAPTTAASSPMPTSVSGPGGIRAASAAITPHSPRSATDPPDSVITPPMLLYDKSREKQLHQSETGLDHYGSVTVQGSCPRLPPGGRHGAGIHPRPDRGRQSRRRGTADSGNRRCHAGGGCDRPI